MRFLNAVGKYLFFTLKVQCLVFFKSFRNIANYLVYGGSIHKQIRLLQASDWPNVIRPIEPFRAKVIKPNVIKPLDRISHYRSNFSTIKNNRFV